MSFLDKTIHEFDTEHDHYQIVETIYRGRPSRVLFSGDRAAAQSGIALDDEDELLFDYIQRFYELATTIQPKKALLIGGGAFSLPIALGKALPGIELDVVEHDQGLIKIARDYFDLKTWPELNIYGADGREFLKQTNQKYDLIMIDAFSNLSIPRSLVTVEAIQVMHDRLAKDGVLAMNAIGSERGKAAIVLERLSAAYHLAFDNVGIFPAEQGFDSWQAQNYMVLAAKHDMSLQQYMRLPALPYVYADPKSALRDVA